MAILSWALGLKAAERMEVSRGEDQRSPDGPVQANIMKAQKIQVAAVRKKMQKMV